MAVRDPTLGQIVWGKFQGNPVSIHDLDPIAPESASHCRQHFGAGFEFYRKHSGLEFLDNLAEYFNRVFFWQIVLLSFPLIGIAFRGLVTIIPALPAAAGAAVCFRARLIHGQRSSVKLFAA